jgi:hypothetical protein
MAHLSRQAAIDYKKQIIELITFVILLRFIQNQLPRRPSSAAAFQSDPDRRVQTMAG